VKKKSPTQPACSFRPFSVNDFIDKCTLNSYR